MFKQVRAILLDTRSIQKYIFSTNKLKLNVGASYLVDTIFDKMEKEILPSFFKPEELKNDWRNSNIQITADDSVKCEIAYVGGGNMIVLFDMGVQENVIKEIIGQWTKLLLVATPGLSTGAAIGVLELGDVERFKLSREKLYRELKVNQNSVFPNVDLPYSGLTVECKLSGKPADLYGKIRDGGRTEEHYISAGEKRKSDSADLSNNNMKNNIVENLREKKMSIEDYNFTYEIEKLGQKKGDEYVAVVHIDGNDMGVRFQSCRNLEATKELSQKVARRTKEALAELVASIVMEYKNYFDKTFAESGMLDGDTKKDRILPIRPIIVGGDDITFVCPGKCGLIYAKRFMEYLSKKEIGGGVFHSCAGIAIVPTKYPFFRAYELAEQLCDEAKKKAREGKEKNIPGLENGSSWLDFLVLHGEQSADLARIRKEEFTGALGNMHYGPYRVAPESASHSVERLINGALCLQDKNKFPRNKVKEMRNVIGKDSGEIRLFMDQFKYSGMKLPKMGEGLTRFNDLWVKEGNGYVTPYLDMIELMDFIYDGAKKMEAVK